ncbi:MAG: hypothetical protein ACX939_09840 [Hyphococcus sp.]
MSEGVKTANRDCEALNATLEKILSIAVRHERRLETLRQECARAATVIYRLKLASDGAKAAAAQREETLEDISRRLAAMERRIEAMAKTDG